MSAATRQHTCPAAARAHARRRGKPSWPKTPAGGGRNARDAHHQPGAGAGARGRGRVHRRAVRADHRHRSQATARRRARAELRQFRAHRPRRLDRSGRGNAVDVPATGDDRRLGQRGVQASSCWASPTRCSTRDPAPATSWTGTWTSARAPREPRLSRSQCLSDETAYEGGGLQFISAPDMTMPKTRGTAILSRPTSRTASPT